MINRLHTFLTDPAAILDAVECESQGNSGQSRLTERAGRIAEELGAQPPDKTKAMLMTLLCRVVVNSDRIEIDISRRLLARLLADQSIDLTRQDQTLDRPSNVLDVDGASTPPTRGS